MHGVVQGQLLGGCARSHRERLKRNSGDRRAGKAAGRQPANLCRGNASRKPVIGNVNFDIDEIEIELEQCDARAPR